MKKLKSKKGITLVALIITIIVMLILAGVAISMMTGDNGVLNQAQNAKSEYSDATLKERVLTQIGYNNSGKLDLKKTKENIINNMKLNEEYTSADFDNETNPTQLTVTLKSGKQVIIKSDGRIEENSSGGSTPELDDTIVGYYGISSPKQGIEFKSDGKIVIYKHNKDDTTTEINGSYNDKTITYNYKDEDVIKSYELELIKGTNGTTIVNKLIYYINDDDAYTENGLIGLTTTGVESNYEINDEEEKCTYNISFNSESGAYTETMTDAYDTITEEGHYFVYNNYVFIYIDTIPGMYFRKYEITENGIARIKL